jgi:radical SAM-linked protein
MEQLLIVKFRVRGYLKYLSHHQSMSMFKRALVRSGIELCYSSGFNPRPKISLPLPRAVGVSSDEELLCISIICGKGENESDLYKRLSPHLPEGIDADSVQLASDGVKLQPASVVYEFCLTEPVGGDIQDSVSGLQKTLAAKEKILLERKGAKKTKNVGGYIEAVDITKSRLQVRCSVTPAGTIRVDEILRLFGIDLSDSVIPVKRKSIGWKYN